MRQARYLWNAGKSGYDFTQRQTEQLARDAYQGVISQIAQVGALKQAVESNQVSLQATEAGYEVGTKTAIDVLSSRELLVQAQTNYSQAKYGYLNNIVALRLAAGNLDAATIQQINGWLVQPQPPPTEATPTIITSPGTPTVGAGGLGECGSGQRESAHSRRGSLDHAGCAGRHADAGGSVSGHGDPCAPRSEDSGPGPCTEARAS